MSTFRELLDWGGQQLAQAGVPDSGLDAWYLMEYVFKLDRAHYFLKTQEEAGDQEERYRELIRRRSGRIPLQHLTHEAWFMGMKFYVDGRVLVPRQDTEILAQEAIKRLEDGQTVLDMCTGSGCLLLSILKEKPLCTGVGADVSGGALEVAKMNGRNLGIFADFRHSDLFAGIQERYDMIVSNPPYIPTKVIEGLEEEVRSHDPSLALDGGTDGLDFYRRISAEAGEYLNSGGWLLLEIGHDQAEAVLGLLKKNRYAQLQVVRDLAGLDRVIIGRKENRRNEDV